MDLTGAFVSLGIALGLGLLVGLQRERARSALAGVRTFPLITLLGVVCGMLSDSAGAWVIAAGLLALAITTAVGNWLRPRPEEPPGITTEVAILLMFAVGAMLWIMPHARQVPVAIGVTCAVLLHLKARLHGLADRVSDDDLRSIMRFALVTFIVLPLLPNQTYGPFDVLNPRQIWWMVVLVVGIGLAAYLIAKFLSSRVSLLVEGLLGGLISSTATTVSYSRAAREPTLAAAVAVVVAIAWSVVFLRVLAEVAVVAPRLLPQLAPPILILFAAALAGVGLLWFGTRGTAHQQHQPPNPTDLSTALKFALVYAAVLWVSAAAQHRFGASGIHIVAAISGLTDMDAITLSSSRLASEGRIAPGDAGRAIVIASMSNVLFKLVLAASIGGAGILRRVGIAGGLTFAAGAALLLLRPW